MGRWNAGGSLPRDLYRAKGVITKCTAEMVHVRLAGDAPEVRVRKTSVVERRETPRSDQYSGAAAAAA
jgi:hypothetical protein